MKTHRVPDRQLKAILFFGAMTGKMRNRGMEILVTVAIRKARLTAVAGELPAGTANVLVCIRTEDVSLALGDDGQSCPRNRLPGVMHRLAREGPLVCLELDCGFPLLTLLTKQGCAELVRREGVAVRALFKAPQVHSIPRLDCGRNSGGYPITIKCMNSGNWAATRVTTLPLSRFTSVARRLPPRTTVSAPNVAAISMMVSAGESLVP